MSFSVLPLELIRKIITQNDERSLLTASVVNKSIYSMKLNKLLFPVQLENFFDIGIETPVNLIERKKMHKHLRDSATRVLKNRITTQKRGSIQKKNTKIYPALFHTYDYIETLNAMIGDATKYDSPYNIYKYKSKTFNWKVLGFMDYEHFTTTNKSDKNMNIWNNSKTLGIKFASNKSLQAII